MSASPPGNARELKAKVDYVLSWLKRHSSKAARDAMARYGIPSDNASGVSVGEIRDLGRRLGHDHRLALALWKTGSYEARMLTPFIAEPDRVTSAQMDRWACDFDSWAICGIGKRNATLHAASVKLARRLAESPHPAARWTGKDALRDLATPATRRRFEKKQRVARARQVQ